jgi:hypothetical protein
MAVTRSTAAERPRISHARKTGWRRDELIGLAAATLILACGLFQVYRAKSADLAGIDHGLASKQLLESEHADGARRVCCRRSRPSPTRTRARKPRSRFITSRAGSKTSAPWRAFTGSSPASSSGS